jgi:hypothetical protein
MKSQANSVHDDEMFLPLFVICDEVDEIVLWGAFQAFCPFSVLTVTLCLSVLILIKDLQRFSRDGAVLRGC